MKKDKNVYTVESKEYSSSFGTLHYMQKGEIGAPIWVMIHGSPGDWQAMKSFLQDSVLSNEFWMIAIDRPRYGGSTYSETIKNNLSSQTQLVSAFIDSLLQNQRVFLLGHSYGGALAAKLLADNNKIDGAVLVAPTLSPQHQSRKFYNYLAKAFQPLLPKSLKRSNEEMWVLKKELESLKSGLQEIEKPVCLIHGTKDWLVSYETVAYCQDYIPKEFLRIVTVEEGGHFILWKKHDLVAKEMLRLANGAK